jgi:flavin-dependent dehydrogenase
VPESVVLVDRECFPGSKLCGDSISPRMLAVLGRLKLANWVDTHGIFIEETLRSDRPALSCPSRV